MLGADNHKHANRLREAIEELPMEGPYESDLDAPGKLQCNTLP